VLLDRTYNQDANAAEFIARHFIIALISMAGSNRVSSFRRWLLEPLLISPGTSMPSELFKRDTAHERWVFNGPTPPAFQTYEKDHVDLLVRYMFQISPDEQKRLGTGGGGAATLTPAAPANKTATMDRRNRRTSGRGPLAAIRAP